MKHYDCKVCIRHPNDCQKCCISQINKTGSRVSITNDEQNALYLLIRGGLIDPILYEERKHD